MASGEGDGREASRDALLGQGDDAAPEGKVVDADVQGSAFAQGADEGAVHGYGHLIVRGTAYVVDVDASACADEGEGAVVGLGGHDVVTEEDGTAAGGADERCRVVAVLEVGGFLSQGTTVVVGSAEGPAVHADERQQRIGSPDVERLADGAKFVGRVEVAAAPAVDFQSPGAPAVVE